MYIFFYYNTNVVYLTLNLLADGHQSHTTIAIIERHADNSYSLKALKQKLFIDGLCYLLQEIYGIENKVNEWNKVISLITHYY